jgi:hypothetical protein
LISIDLAGVAHLARQRPTKRMRVERLRPEAGFPPGPRPAGPQLGKLDQLLVGAAPGGLVAHAHQQVLRLEQHACGLGDVVLVGTDAHRHVEPAWTMMVEVASPQHVGGQREDRSAGGSRRRLHAAAHGLRIEPWFCRPVPFRDGLGHHLAMVGLLEQVAAERVCSTEATATITGIGPSSC